MHPPKYPNPSMLLLFLIVTPGFPPNQSVLSPEDTEEAVDGENRTPNIHPGNKTIRHHNRYCRNAICSEAAIIATHLSFFGERLLVEIEFTRLQTVILKPGRTEYGSNLEYRVLWCNSKTCIPWRLVGAQWAEPALKLRIQHGSKRRGGFPTCVDFVCALTEGCFYLSSEETRSTSLALAVSTH